MGQPDDILNADFDSPASGLFPPAEAAITACAAVVRRAEPEPPADPVVKAASLVLPQIFRPLVQELEAVRRATNENTTILKKLESAAAAPTDGPVDLPKVAIDLRALLDAKNGLNQSMFAALHQELKGYKDGFLLEAVHRPIIRDLISLYDDIAGIQRQVTATIADPDSAAETPLVVRMVERLRTIEMNLEHNLEFIAEVLNRLEVTLTDPHTGKLDKRTQRVVGVEHAEDPDEEGDVVRTVKRGFLWKDRVLRAEEVVVKKWKEGFLVALQPSPQP